MSEHEPNHDAKAKDEQRSLVPRESGAGTRLPLVLALAGAGLLLPGVGLVVARRGTPVRPNTAVVSATTLKPKEMVQASINTARATLRLKAETIRAVLNQVDPTKFGPPEMPFKISFVPNPNLDGGTMSLDFGEGVCVDTVTISGKVTTSFTVGFNAETKTVTVTIQMIFDEARVHAAEDPEADPETTLSGTFQLHGNVTAQVELHGFSASCSLYGPLEITVNAAKVTVYTNGVTGVLEGLQGTVVFNGSSRLVFEGSLLDYGKWRVTFYNLLLRLKTLSIDSGRFKAERLDGLIDWVIVYKFLYPNGGDKTIYPPAGGYTEPFLIEFHECPGPASAPSGLTATAVSDTQVDLSWTNTSPNVKFIKVERRVATTAGGSDVFRELARLPADRTSFSDATVVSNTAYEYQLLAWNCKGDSAPSTVVSTPPSPLMVLSMTPTHGRAGLSGDQVVITVANLAQSTWRSDRLAVEVHFTSSFGGTGWDGATITNLTTLTVDASGTVTILTEVPSQAETGPVVVTSGGQQVSAGTFIVD